MPLLFLVHNPTDVVPVPATLLAYTDAGRSRIAPPSHAIR
jgi:hypothetical protein